MIKSIKNLAPVSKVPSVKITSNKIINNMERSPIGDVFIHINEKIKQAARRGVEIPNGKNAIREFSTYESKLLDMQIEEGNNLKELSKIYKVTIDEMCKILKKNKKDTLLKELATIDNERSFQDAISNSRYATTKDIAKEITSIHTK